MKKLFDLLKQHKSASAEGVALSKESAAFIDALSAKKDEIEQHHKKVQDDINRGTKLTSRKVSV